jgi:hypothetical protein
MAVRVENDVVHLEGDCGVEDAEAVAAALGDPAIAKLDLRLCRQLHGAVAQALLVFRPEIVGLPADAFLNGFILPALSRPVGHSSPAIECVRGRP